jgi:hypothetical protein
MDHNKAISLSFEVRDLIDTLEGARILADGVRNSQLATEDDARQAAASVISLLTLTTMRLRLMAAVLDGGMAPRWLWSPSNHTVPTREDSRDISLLCDDDPGTERVGQHARPSGKRRRRRRTTSDSHSSLA